MLLEAMVGFMIIAISVPAVMAMVALSQWNNAEAEAYIQSFAVAQSEIEWLQANCSDFVAQLIAQEPESYNPDLDKSCLNYPKGIPQKRDDISVPGFYYVTEISALEEEEGNLDVAEVTVTVHWTRTFAMRAPGKRSYVGLIFGTAEGYYVTWE